MLYKMNITDNNKVVPQLEPARFSSFKNLGLREKDLENIISENLFEVLYSESPLMPIYQERQYEMLGDIYALNEYGDLTIFELKRETAGDDAILQLFNYAQAAGTWNYNFLDQKYRIFLQINNKNEESLEDAHQKDFKVKLPHEQFNRRQQLIIIGNAADRKLINIVQYCNKQGMPISFAPYRIYQFKEDIYFEFFTPPYDQHDSPSENKGIIIDTNETYKYEGGPDVWYMMENSRIAAFGDQKVVIDLLNKGDIVFFYHQGWGIVAAGTVKSDRKEDNKMNETWYRDVDFLTTPPNNDQLKYMPAEDIVREFVKETGKRVFWATTAKKPYLSIDAAKRLVEKLKHYVN